MFAGPIKAVYQELWKTHSYPEAKFSIGQVVYHQGVKDKVIGVNSAGDGIEYLLEFHTFLVWEDELSAERQK